MASATIIWTPVGGIYSVNQIVYYKALQDAAWTVFATVSSTTDAAIVDNLVDNVLYQFRVQNSCVGGTNANSNLAEVVNLTCPAPINITPTETSAVFSFTHVGGDVSNYLVDLLSSGNTILDSRSINSPGATVTDTFTGLTPSTDYKIQVTTKVTGTLGDQISICGSVTFRSNDVICNPPTAVIAVMS